MAEVLRKEDGAKVEEVRGRIGELSVLVNDAQVYSANPFWYPRTDTVIAQIRKAIGKAR